MQKSTENQPERLIFGTCQAASIRIFRFIRFHYQVTYIYSLTIMGFSSPDFHLACEHTFLVAGVISSGQPTWVFY